MVVVPGMLENLVFMGKTLQMVLESPQALTGARNLDVAELWSGKGSVKKAAENQGYRAAKMDKYNTPGVTDKPGPDCEDIISTDGFAFAVRVVLSLCPGGLLVMAPTCASFIWMNISKTGRSRINPTGDLNYPPVREGNMEGAAAAFLFALGTLRGVNCLCENPTWTYLFKLPVWLPVLSWFDIKFANVARCAFDSKRPGTRFKKVFKFAGQAWCRCLCMSCRCPTSVHRASSCTFKHRITGKRQVTGLKPELRESASYPPELGKWIIRSWMAHRSGQSQPVQPVQSAPPVRVKVLRAPTRPSRAKVIRVVRGQGDSCARPQKPWKNGGVGFSGSASSSVTLSEGSAKRSWKSPVV